MFKISLTESSALRIIANTVKIERFDVLMRMKYTLRSDAMEIANALVDDVNSSNAAKIAAEEFLAAAKVRQGW
jgi:hypothetical protein